MGVVDQKETGQWNKRFNKKNIYLVADQQTR